MYFVGYCGIFCRAGMAGSALQFVLPLALIIWMMRRSGMMGVSYFNLCAYYFTQYT